MSNAYKGYGIHVVILTSCGSIRVFSRADILQAVQTVTKSHRSSILPCGAESAIHLQAISLLHEKRLQFGGRSISTRDAFGLSKRGVEGAAMVFGKVFDNMIQKANPRTTYFFARRCYELYTSVGNSCLSISSREHST